MTYDDIELYKYIDCEGDFMGDNWSCAGCMEKTACNFDAEALIENYICEFQIEGHNADDVIDDGSCAYPSCVAVAPTHEEFSNGALPIGFCLEERNVHITI